MQFGQGVNMGLQEAEVVVCSRILDQVLPYFVRELRHVRYKHVRGRGSSCPCLLARRCALASGGDRWVAVPGGGRAVGALALRLG
eukprot:2591816-Pyramimonas_sp.AAC.1